MPLIQRNLFPSRPPSKKNDGPSILRANGQLANQHQQQQHTIMNPILTMYTTSNKLKSLDSSLKNSKLYSKQTSMDKKDSKKLRKSQSASMISLLAINNNNQQQHGSLGQPNGNRKVGNGGGGGGTGTGNNNHNHNNKINYDSQDSFNSSDASCSDPQSLCSSSSSVDNMISRRRILSRSKDALNNNPSVLDDFSSDGFNPAHPTSMPHQQQQQQPNLDEDVWHNKHQLISDHIEEILTKWDQIDDEIWAKVICMERNRRVAKAYARTPILTINGYEAGFDGHRIGLNGFDNPMRDKRIAEIKTKIEDGIKIRMDQDGSLLVKRLTDLDVFILCNDKQENVYIEQKIEQRKSIVLFDMKQYQNELLKQIKNSAPNLRGLEQKCFCFITFGQYSEDLLNTPVWCIIINLVALEMLVKLIPFRISDDNFYSLPLSLSSKVNGYYTSFPGNGGSMPPKLPPRDLHNKKPPLTLPEPDYEDDDDNNNNNNNYNNQNHDENNENVIRSSNKSISTKIVDDPYYHGLSAHVPKFAHPTRNLVNMARSINNTITNNNYHHPPIVRKAMNKKLWNYNNNHNHDIQQSNDSGHYNMLNDEISNTTMKNVSTFDPMTLLPINDNNEIYGINPSLLRNKNRPFHIRSSSSPSLKNIFSRKKSNNNNNSSNTNNKDPRIH